MTGLLEARDLTNGSVATAPACLQLAPDPAVVADLLHDESRMMAAAAASVAQPGTLDELRMVLRWHAAHGHRMTVSGSLAQSDAAPSTAFALSERNAHPSG
jgi:hypothetical protein